MKSDRAAGRISSALYPGRVIVHFVCRGNAFRSILAEAYLNSLGIKDTSVLSSGTVAAQDKDRNLDRYRMTLELLEQHGIREFAKAGYGEQLTQSLLDRADVTVCLNQRVYDECLGRVRFPGRPADLVGRRSRRARPDRPRPGPAAGLPRGGVSRDNRPR